MGGCLAKLGFVWGVWEGDFGGGVVVLEGFDWIYGWGRLVLRRLGGLRWWFGFEEVG